MMTLNDLTRRYASLGIAALMLTLSVAIPVLERADFVDEPVAESEHGPTDCPRGHDHTVCRQVNANSPSISRRLTPQLTDRVLVVASPPETPRVGSSTFREGHPSRAPPLA